MSDRAQPASVQIHSINAPGATVTYEVSGSGPVLLLLHGIGLDRRCWTAVRDALAVAFRVIAVDLRGHGTSVAEPNSVTLPQFADDVRAVLADADVAAPVHVCAHSLGALVAVHLATDYPGLVRTLVLCNGWVYNAYAAAHVDQLAQATREQTMSQLATDRTPLALAPGSDPRLVNELAAVLAAKDPANYLATAVAMWTADLRERVGAVAVPTLVVAGEQDQIVSIDQTSELVAAIPGAQLRTIPGVGHVPHLEAPITFDAVLREFLSANTPPRARM